MHLPLVVASNGGHNRPNDVRGCRTGQRHCVSSLEHIKPVTLNSDDEMAS